MRSVGENKSMNQKHKPDAKIGNSEKKKIKSHGTRHDPNEANTQISHRIQKIHR